MKADFTVTGRYLQLPIARGAQPRFLVLRVDGVIVRQFEACLAEGKPDFWSFFDAEPFRGKQLTIETDAALPDNLVFSDEIREADTFYTEKYRPQFHFSSRRGWINDPIGLHYHEGIYHMFYQHNPHGVQWGNMHWGYAVSDDFLHWEDKGDVLFPDETGTMFSGCGVVDWHNTAGFQTGETPAQVLLYTVAGDTSPVSKGRPSTICLAYSNDKGRTWTRYAGNPVIEEMCKHNRDPKVFWHNGQWIMALYLEKSRFALLSSPDLKAWAMLQEITLPGCGECPDLFALPVDGDPACIKWVLSAATNGAYLVGSFDGQRFTPESEVQFLVPEGAHSYAAQTWSDIPDGRRIQSTWGRFDIPDMPFNSFTTFPCVLSLRNTKTGIRLGAYPIAEIEALRGQALAYTGLTVSDSFPIPAQGELLDIDAQFDTGDVFGFQIFGTEITYDAAKQTLACGGLSCPMEGGKVSLRILVDKTSIEVFGNGGLAYIPLGLIHKDPGAGVSVFSRQNPCTLSKLQVYPLKSIWGRRA